MSVMVIARVSISRKPGRKRKTFYIAATLSLMDSDMTMQITM
ncbi:hypothetical protein EYZ11_009505 [Aspergillus tanneri]|uniref:Uncharacterized protein n=1 Tax=Aspergillus tanneri TaxID=1220188 RepID=A0A4S3J7Q2_9EURO|nr:hypothetical protein EYZ11_009505 [Aspergillus tanneri]